jgi:hypothetical protein
LQAKYCLFTNDGVNMNTISVNKLKALMTATTARQGEGVLSAKKTRREKVINVKFGPQPYIRRIRIDFSPYRAYTKQWCALKSREKIISLPTRAQHTISAAGTVLISYALLAVRFSCLLQGRETSFQDGVTARDGFLRAPF